MIWILLKCVISALLLGILCYLFYEQYAYWRFKKVCEKLVEEGKMRDLEYDRLADEDECSDEACEGCGRSPEDPGHCPWCCESSYTCGSEQCDMCPYENECAEDNL